MKRIPFNKTVINAFWCLLGFSSIACAGVEEIARECDSCHGDNGVSQHDDVPTIAGISATSHADALYIYLDEARPCHEAEHKTGDKKGESTDMCAIVAAMSEDDLEAIAEYYAAKPFVAAKQEFDADKATAGKAIHDDKCDRCHSDGGANPDDDSSILAGQWAGYMRQSYADYRAGTREQVSNMEKVISPLSDDDIEALVHYYASQQ